MGRSKDGKTTGITLRVNTNVLGAYASIANRQNAVDLKSGGRGLITAQAVMRERLESNPEVIAELAKETSSDN